MSYTFNIPASPSFASAGLKGYHFEPLKNPELDVHYLDVIKGHDVFQISKKLYRTYYILEGNGYFIIDNHKYDVVPGMLVEIPPDVEYTYSGTMKILLISNPHWFKGNEEITKNNPDVMGRLSVKSFISKIKSLKPKGE